MQRLTPMVKNLLILNIAIYIIGIYTQGSLNLDLTRIFGLYYFGLSEFRWYQIITNFFLHANFNHLLFNMVSLFSVGTLLERFWGAKRFFHFYMICGIGASIIYLISIAIPIYLKTNHFILTLEDLPLVENNISMVAVGASGAIFGVFTAIARLFPNSEFYMLFIPVPIKAKYLWLGLVIIDIMFGFMNVKGDNLGHFAHLGGVITGLILVTIWQKDRTRFF